MIKREKIFEYKNIRLRLFTIKEDKIYKIDAIPVRFGHQGTARNRFRGIVWEF